MYVPHEDGIIVVASQGGAPRSPVWYRNLVESPDIEAQYRSRRMKLRARQVDDAEKGAALADLRRALPVVRGLSGPHRPEHPRLRLRAPPVTRISARGL